MKVGVRHHNHTTMLQLVYHACYVTQQLKMNAQCTSHWFHRFSASSALPAFPNATRALQTLAGSRPECRRDMPHAIDMPSIVLVHCDCNKSYWHLDTAIFAISQHCQTQYCPAYFIGEQTRDVVVRMQ